MQAEFPNNNYGSDTRLNVRSDAKTRRTYIKFDLSSIPSGKSITSAKLYLHCVFANPTSSVQVNVNETGDSWSEGAITWNNAPSVGAFVASTDVGGVNQSYFWDITSYAQTEYSGDKILSVVVKFLQDDPSQNNPNYERKFASKENSDVSIRPYLEIVYTTTPPTASFTFSPSHPVANDTVTFNASASYDPDGSIVSYKWDFGDGNITTVIGPIITHVFSTENNYTVTLTVTDNEGLTDSVIDIVPVVDPATLHVSLPDGTVVGSNSDEWLNKGWVLNQTGTAWSFTVKVTETSNAHTSYDVHLIIALNDAAYNNLVSLSVNGTTIPKSAFQNGTPTPYGLWTWSSDVYPTWFNDTYVNLGMITPNGYKTAVVSANFSDPTDTRMHFDAYGKLTTGTPKSKGETTSSPNSEDSTVLGQPLPQPQPPIADFSWSPTYPQTNETVTFDASTSYDPDGGSIVSYKWDFGDGNETTTSNPTITHKFATFGNYNVNLTVTDDENQTGSKNQTVTVRQPPVASFTYSPSKPLVDEPVEFDASASTPDGGTITGYKWDFDNGNVTTTSNPIIIHSYNVSAEYNVTLTVFDSEGKADNTWQIVKVHSPPHANFTFEPDWPDMGEVVTFNATGSYDLDGTIISYHWDFGDNTTAEENDPITTHIYTSPGDHTVKLTVTDNDGFNSSTTATVTVNPAILHVSLPDGTYVGDDPDPWLSKGWLLNITGTSGTFTLRINNTSGDITSYDTHLIIALNNVSYSNLVSLSVNGTPISAFQFGTPNPYDVWNWPSGDVYPTWFNDTYIVGTIEPKNYVDLIISVTFSNTTGVRMHFDAYGKRDGVPPKGNITHNPISEDSTVLFWPLLQYYLTVKTDPAGIVTIPGEGWYDNCTYVNLTAPQYVNVSANTRYRFDYWDVDGANVSGNPITVHMDANHTATAHYILQYLVTFNQTGLDATAIGTVVTVNGAPKNFGDLPFSMWVDNGSSVTYNYSTIVSSSVSGKRFRLDSISSPPSPFIVTGPVTITGNYKTQYQLTVRTNGLGTNSTSVYNGTTILGTATDATPYTNWFDEGGSLQLNIDSPITVGSTRFMFTQWSGDATGTNRPLSVTMNSAKDITANYKTQYKVTFDQSGVGTDFAGTIVTIDGIGYNVTGLPVSFWWDKNSQHNFSFVSPLVVNASKQYVWISTSGLSNLQSDDTFTITSSGSVVGNYSTEVKYQITFDQTGAGSDFNGTIVIIDGIPCNRTTLPVSFLWDLNSTHTFAFQSPLVVTPNAKQYVWNSTSGLSSLQSGSINVSMSGSVVGNYKTHYYLTMSTNFGTVTPGSGWHDAGSTVQISASAPSVVDGERYVWLGWAGTGDGNYTGMNNPATITMNSPITETASWRHEYRLIMDTNFGTTNPSVGEHWYEAGSTVEISATAPSVIPDEQYVWLGWTGTGSGSYSSTDNPASITMNGPITETAAWRHEYYLTVTSPYDTPTPTSGWFEAGTEITASVTSPWPGPIGTQYVCTGWTGTGSVPASGSTASVAFTINEPSNITWTWKTQYYLTVSSTHGTTGGEGWYDEGDTAYATVTPLTVSGPTGVRYVFIQWSGDASGTSSPSDPIIMNGPKTAVANWKTQYYLTVKTDPSGLSPAPGGEGWYDANTNVDLQAPDPSYKGSVEYSFKYWKVDGVSQGTGVKQITVPMDSPHTAIAYYQGPPRKPVGGHIVPIRIAEEPSLQTFQIGFASAFLAAIAIMTILIRRKSKRALKIPRTP
ncbi:MAG: PKD domain-containing protein [Candidatus Bathyarchaeia archaeon]